MPERPAVPAPGADPVYANRDPMTCWVPACHRTRMLMRDGAGWWWCWRHWRSHKLWSRFPAEIRWRERGGAS